MPRRGIDGGQASQYREALRRLSLQYQYEGLSAVARRLTHYVLNWYVSRRDTVRWFLGGRRLNAESDPVHANGFRLRVHGGDPGISRELGLYGMHEPLATSLLKRYVSPGSNVVDVGSNIGYYAISAAHLAGSTGKVLAVEPEPRNFTLLMENARLNGLENVRTVCCAIGDQDGSGTLLVTRRSNHHRLVEGREVERNRIVNVPVRSLDSLLQEFAFGGVNLIRMDIEGGEVDAIEGMKATLRRDKPTLLMELHPCVVDAAALSAMLVTLDSLGYSPRHLIDRSEDFAWTRDRRIVDITSMGGLRRKLETLGVATVVMA